MTPALTVVILTRDCEDTLPRTLASVAFADEILLVDSGSTDRTLELAEGAGARVLRRPLTDWAEQRNAGHAAARGRWVLALDSDEVLDREVSAAVREVVARPAGAEDLSGYQFLVRNYFLGRPLLHGGLEHDYHLRLALRDRSRWEGRVHERLIAEGPVGRLPGVVHHYTGRSLSQRLQKVAVYGTARAAAWRACGRTTSVWRACWEPLRFFLGRILLRRGYRDGIHGIVWWWLMATEILVGHLIAVTMRDDPSRRRTGEPD